MVYSDCHNAPVHVNPEWTGMGGNAYICDECNKPCRWHEPNADDPRGNTTDELRKQLLAILKTPAPGQDTDTLSHIYTCGFVTVDKCPHIDATLDRLEALLEAQRQQWEAAARIDQLKQLKADIQNPSKFMTAYDHLASRGKLIMAINEEIATLDGELGKEQ